MAAPSPSPRPRRPALPRGRSRAAAQRGRSEPTSAARRAAPGAAGRGGRARRRRHGRRDRRRRSPAAPRRSRRPGARIQVLRIWSATPSRPCPRRRRARACCSARPMRCWPKARSPACRRAIMSSWRCGTTGPGSPRKTWRRSGSRFSPPRSTAPASACPRRWRSSGGTAARWASIRPWGSARSSRSSCRRPGPRRGGRPPGAIHPLSHRPDPRHGR